MNSSSPSLFILSLPIPGIISTCAPRFIQGYSCSKATTQECGKEVFDHLKIFLVHIPICTDMIGSKDFYFFPFLVSLSSPSQHTER
jgi:hypothetical protein